MHPAYAQAPAYAAPQMQAVAPTPVQTWPAPPAWQPAPPQAYAPQPVYVVANYAQPAAEPAYSAAREPARRPAAQALQPGSEYSAMDEIRESLREFREAVQGLAEQRRRYP
jgi:succinoglycan biosynthesis transport protein ExoP